MKVLSLTSNILTVLLLTASVVSANDDDDDYVYVGEYSTPELASPLPPGPRQGECPMTIMGCPSDRTPDPIQCTYDHECDEPLKCCSTPCFGRACTRPQRVREGTCPDPKVMKIACDGSRPVETCKYDTDCSAGKKCCQSPCGGVECFQAGSYVQPDTSVPPTSPSGAKPGECEPRRKGVMCPINSYNNSVAECSNDYDCYGTNKCCLQACVKPQCKPPVKPGQCMASIQGCPTGKTDPMDCEVDSQCPGDEKCCSTPCFGTSCQKPDPSTLPAPSNPGYCPVFFVGCLPGQEDDPIECLNDLDCEPNEKCCASPCNGKKCYNSGVGKQGQCEDPKREVSLCMAGVYANSTAQCSHDGQCPGTQKCCPQTCVKPLCAEPKKAKRGECQDFSGVMAKCIEGAYENSTAECDDDDDCEGENKCCPQLCIKPLCKAPLPEKHAGQCPAFTKPACTDDDDTDDDERKFECKDDGDCDSTEKCCATNCLGLRCQPAIFPPPNTKVANPGSCPSEVKPNSESQCADDTCEDDQGCVGEQKCCKNTCGKNQCVYPPKPQVCPVFNRTAVCDDKRYPYECNPRTGGCDSGSRCCEYECSGTRCDLDLCDAPDNNIQCFRAESRDCESSTECDDNQICCEIYCGGTRCKPAGSSASTGGIQEYKAQTSTPECGPVCMIFCEFGNVMDDKGCPTCACKPSPCEDVKCEEGEVCEVQEVQCIKAPCYPIGVCCAEKKTTCPPLGECGIRCAYGHAYDENDCELCQCHDPCKNVECSDGQVCEGREVQCFRAPCLPQGFCVDKSATGGIQEYKSQTSTPECGPVCKIFCEFGNVMDDKGCPTCACKPSPCEGVKCAEGEKCVTQQVQCIKAPCDPVPVCVNDTKSCPMVCDIFCEYGHVLDENLCPTCACVEPCKNVECQEGQECQVQQVQCKKAPCYPRGFCVDKQTPTCGPVCAIFCEFGNVMDERGCPTCRCNTDPCEKVTCDSGKQCEVQQVLCYRPPCPPVATCVIKTTTEAPVELVCPAPEKDVSCPSSLSRGACTSDKECGARKCCDTGCQYNICKEPVRPGHCPFFDPALIRCREPTDEESRDRCKSDSECPGAQKCCSPPCPNYGLTCMNPE